MIKNWGRVVLFIGSGKDEVLLRTRKGPVLGNVTVSRFGTKPPERVSLKAGAALDDQASIALALGMVRMLLPTLSKSKCVTKLRPIRFACWRLCSPRAFFCGHLHFRHRCSCRRSLLLRASSEGSSKGFLQCPIPAGSHCPGPRAQGGPSGSSARSTLPRPNTDSTSRQLPSSAKCASATGPVATFVWVSWSASRQNQRADGAQVVHHQCAETSDNCGCKRVAH